jgi:hypothetical protein
MRLGTTLPSGCGTLFGAFEAGRLVGVFLHSTTILLASSHREALEAFAAHTASSFDAHPVTELLGPAEMVSVFYEAFRRRLPDEPRVRLYRRDLPFMELQAHDLKSNPVRGSDGVAVEPAPLRRALDRDLASLMSACRAMTREELGVDPAADAPAAFQRNLERKIRAGREFIWSDDGNILFRASVSTSTPEAALVEGVFTPSIHRGEGRATRGMLALCRRLLAHHSAVVLFVSAANDPAMRLYERMGFRTIGTYQAVYFHSVPLPVRALGSV